MSVSVIIPTYNGKKYLGRTLDSVLSQTYTDLEVVVVDDGSTDSVDEILSSFSKKDGRLRSVRQQNGGIAVARNRGISEANPKFQYLALLDHDDLWEENTLESLIYAHRKFSGTIGSHGRVRVIDADGTPVNDRDINHWYSERRGYSGGSIQDWPDDKPTSLEVMALRPQIMTVGQVLFQKSAIKNMELFDASTAPADDFDFWLRLLLIGDLAFAPQPVVAWRKHSSNTSRNTQLMMSKDAAVRNKAINLRGITDKQRKILIDGTKAHNLELSKMRFTWAKDALKSRDLVSATKHLVHAARNLSAAKSNSY